MEDAYVFGGGAWEKYNKSILNMKMFLKGTYT